MNVTNANAFPEKEKLGPLMRKYAIPCIISLLVAALYNMIRKYGAADLVFGQAQYAQIPMAVVGIVMKFFRIVISVVVGMASLFIAEALSGQLIKIFGAANESVYYTEFALKAFRIYLCMTILACVNKAAFIYLQSLGKALLSTLLSTVREVVFGVGFALLLPVFFGLGGVLYSMPVSDILTFLISASVIIWTYRILSQE